TWQLVINTGTTIVTFLMVFLIQRAQNKDSRAIHFKLNEVIAAMDGASNRLIDVEGLDEREMAQLHRYHGKLVEITKRDCTLTRSHSIEEAEQSSAVNEVGDYVRPGAPPPRGVRLASPRARTE